MGSRATSPHSQAVADTACRTANLRRESHVAGRSNTPGVVVVGESLSCRCCRGRNRHCRLKCPAKCQLANQVDAGSCRTTLRNRQLAAVLRGRDFCTASSNSHPSRFNARIESAGNTDQPTALRKEIIVHSCHCSHWTVWLSYYSNMPAHASSLTLMMILPLACPDSSRSNAFL
jgi:hypothetical protein